MRVLIVDDEPLARTALEQILTGRPDVEWFDSAADAFEAQQWLAKNQYDVILLDIKMPERSGLELLARLEHNRHPLPAVVLVTAHPQHAVTAFERHAVDYVVKPFSAERINQALEVARQRSASDRAARLLELMPHLQGMTSPPSPANIAIKSNGRILFLNPRDIAVVEAEGNYVLLRQGEGSYLLRESISEVAEKLKSCGFVRIHRSVLVNAAFVREIRPMSTGEYELQLKDGTQYTVTRTHKKNLKSLAGFWIGTGTTLAD